MFSGLPSVLSQSAVNNVPSSTTLLPPTRSGAFTYRSGVFLSEQKTTTTTATTPADPVPIPGEGLKIKRNWSCVERWENARANKQQPSAIRNRRARKTAPNDGDRSEVVCERTSYRRANDMFRRRTWARTLFSRKQKQSVCNYERPTRLFSVGIPNVPRPLCGYYGAHADRFFRSLQITINRETRLFKITLRHSLPAE